jgi:hypothetical protein
MILDILGVELGGLALVLLGLLIVRVARHVAVSMVRASLSWQSAVFPKWLGPRPSRYAVPVYQVFFLVLGVLSIGIGLAMFLAPLPFLLFGVVAEPKGAPVPRAAPAATPADMWFGMGLGAVLLCLAVWCWVKRHWIARILQWFWDLDRPLDEPYPQQRGLSESAPRAFVRAAVVMGLLIAAEAAFFLKLGLSALLTAR